MTYKDKGSYESSPPCIIHTLQHTEYTLQQALQNTATHAQLHNHIPIHKNARTAADDGDGTLSSAFSQSPSNIVGARRKL